MLKYLSLLIITLTFSFTVDYLSNSKKNIKILKVVENIHNKNLDIGNNLDTNFDLNNHKKAYSKKFVLNDNYQKLPKNIKILNSKKIFSVKKTNFIKTLLPLINYENDKIILERNRLKRVRNFLRLEKTLSSNDLRYLTSMLKKYKISSKNKHKIDLIDELLLNVDTIPSSIVLAQAANESGWGTSRFAIEYNALFGQYTYDKNNGVVPFDREEGKKHLIRNFSSIDKSVASYFKNINSHYAYASFRNIRNKIKDVEDINYRIKQLTESLSVYAEDKSYVNTINSIIDSNKLTQFDL